MDSLQPRRVVRPKCCSRALFQVCYLVVESLFFPVEFGERRVKIKIHAEELSHTGGWLLLSAIVAANSPNASWNVFA